MVAYSEKLKKLFLNLPFIFTNPAKIVMFHLGRCGSTVLGNLLNQHLNIFWDSEIYEKIGRRSLPELYITSNPFKLIRMRMLWAGRYYGFETKLMQKQNIIYNPIGMSLPEFVDRLKKMGFDHFIILNRRNYLRQVVSGAIGFKNKLWHQPYIQKPFMTRIYLDVNNVPFGHNYKPLFARFDEFDATYKLLNHVLTNQRVLRLNYEDDVLQDPVKAYRRVCSFLGIDCKKVSTRLRKMNPFDLSDIITNFGDIEIALRGTSYEWMLYD